MEELSIFKFLDFKIKYVCVGIKGDIIMVDKNKYWRFCIKVIKIEFKCI